MALFARTHIVTLKVWPGARIFGNVAFRSFRAVGMTMSWLLWLSRAMSSYGCLTSTETVTSPAHGSLMVWLIHRDKVTLNGVEEALKTRFKVRLDR